MLTKEILNFILETYGVSPEFLWEDSDAAALRHPCGKWFGVWMRISRKKLGLASDEPVEILNLKRDPMLGIADGERIFPAYHMNKEHWISVVLDGSLSLEKVQALVDMSYELVGKKKGTRSKMQ